MQQHHRGTQWLCQALRWSIFFVPRGELVRILVDSKHAALVTLCKPFWLKPFLFKTALLQRVRLFDLVIFSCILVSRAMPRNGWTTMQVPDGWLQVIRGPRPPSVKWPKARQQTPQRGRKVQPEQRPEQVRRAPFDPDTIMANARVRVTKLEAAMQSVGESDPTYPSLLEALKTARSQAQVKPVQDRIAGTEAFLERARKRASVALQELDSAREKLATAEGKLALEEESVHQVEARLLELRQEANGMAASPTPTVPADVVQELTRLASFVEELQRERDELQAELAAQVATSEGRPRKSNRSVPTPS